MNVKDARRENMKRLIGGNSQRAWAQSVGMLPAHVNQILKGKRNIGDKLARKLEAKVGLEMFALDQEAVMLTGVKPAAIDAEVFISTLEQTRDAVRGVGMDMSEREVTKLAIDLYNIYAETSELLDIPQTARLLALRSQ